MAINKESVALNVINESLKLPFVKVDRSDFLTKIFINKIDDMPKLFKEGPQCIRNMAWKFRRQNGELRSHRIFF